MIKQKDVEKCRFFTITGGDMWKIKKVRTVTELELENCETGRSEMCRVGEQSAERFVAINMPAITHRGRPAKPTPAKPGRGRGRPRKSDRLASGGVNASSSQPKPEVRPSRQVVRGEKNRQGVRKGKKPSSQYFGVTVRQTKKSGPIYHAQCNRGGEYKNLGVYKVEELAAAAAQEHLGNHAEATRLRIIARQKTDTAIKELKGQTGPVKFMCHECGADYKKKPERCEKCGGGTFENIYENS